MHARPITASLSYRVNRNRDTAARRVVKLIVLSGLRLQFFIDTAGVMPCFQLRLQPQGAVRQESLHNMTQSQIELIIEFINRTMY
jgi:hypothetical protein